MASDRVAVHLDLVTNHNPRTLYDHRAIFSDAVRRLGSRCVSAHIKDIGIEIYPTNTRLNEVPMGEGSIDLEHMAACLDSISVDLPIMLEHLPDEAAYDRATRVFTQAARQAHVHLKEVLYKAFAFSWERTSRSCQRAHAKAEQGCILGKSLQALSVAERKDWLGTIPNDVLHQWA